MPSSLAILGTGNMAEALLAGILAQSILRPRQVIGYDVNPGRLKQLRKKYGISIASSAQEALARADAVLLAVKPQQMAELLNPLKATFTKRHLLLSIAAGLDTRFFEKIVGKDRRIVRLMPNTPALVGLGATAFFANKKCSSNDIRTTHALFGAVGIVRQVAKESLLDAVTGVSGSGPAFVYSFARALIEAGVANGLSPDTARELAIQTLLGASKLLEQSSEPIESLIQKVASKGGTTEAGLGVLRRKKFDKLVGECVTAAVQRANELRGN